MLRVRRCLTAVVTTSVVASHIAAGQQKVAIYVDHSPGASDASVTYQLPGDAAREPRTGLSRGDHLVVTNGDKACFEVTHPNRLLYTYSLSSKAVFVALDSLVPDALKLAIAAIGKISPSLAASYETAADGGSAAAGGETKAPGQTMGQSFIDFDDLFRRAFDSTVDTARTTRALAAALMIDSAHGDTGVAIGAVTGYLRSILSIEHHAAALQQLEIASDTMVSFRTATAKAADAALHIAADSAVAKRYRGDRRVFPADTLPGGIVWQLDQLLVLLEHQAAVLEQEIGSASGPDTLELCTSIKDPRTSLSLSIQQRRKTTKHTRTVDTAAFNVILDARSDKIADVGGGILFGVNVPNKNFAVANSVITSTASDAPLLRPAAFLNVRMLPTSVVWVTVGVGKGSLPSPDFYVGLTLRPDLPAIGDLITVGAGLGVFYTDVGLTQGAVGSALPPNVSNINDIVQREYRAALGVTLTLSGLKLGS